MLLRTSIRPWYPALKKLRLELSDDDGVIWLHFGEAPIKQDAATTTVEGLQLVAYLASVSWADFRFVVGEVWPAAEAQLDKPMRVGVKLHCVRHGFVALRACFTFPPRMKGTENWTRTARPSDSALYVDTRRVLDQARSRSPRLVDGERDCVLEIPVDVIAGSWTSADSRKIPNLMLAVAMAQDSRRPDASDDDDHELNMRLAKVTFDDPYIFSEGEYHVSVLNELVSCGVKISRCCVPCLDEKNKNSARELFLAVQKLFQTHELAAQNAFTSARIDGLVFNVSAMEPRLCSAIAATRAVRCVLVRSAYHGITPRVVHLLAVALFSGLAHHAVEEVDITMYSREELQAFRTILINNTEDPLITVFSGHTESIRANQHLRATASRFALYKPTGDQGHSSVVTVKTFEHMGLRIIDHQDGWWSVLLPAWGRAWVRDSDVVVTSGYPAAGWRMGNATIGKIALTCMGADIGDFASVVQVMNLTVEDLRLGGTYDVAAPLDVWPRIVSALQSLRALSIGVLRSDQLDSIVNAFSSAEFLPMLARLRLEAEWRLEPNPTEFIDALCDFDSRLYQCLESLVVRVMGRGGPREAQSLAIAVGDMLSKNKRLASLEFGVSSTYGAPAFAAVKRTLKPHDGDVIQHYVRPLALVKKLALISAVQATRGEAGRDGSALQRLDSGPLSTIMRFAATCGCRTVCVEKLPYVS